MAPPGLWQWKTVGDAAGLEDLPPALPPGGAQPWCNFTVWEPTELPAGCTTTAGTLRKEAPPGRTGASTGRTPWSDANPSAYRIEIGGGGRRLRLKQFLYDWAFPAADHPCLWGSPVRPHPIGSGRVVWCGTDYLGHPAASARMNRTTVELSVLEGEFTDEELAALYRGLHRADADADARVLATPFSALSYWARHPVVMVAVPTGLFRCPLSDDRPHEGDWVPTGELAGFLADRQLPGALGAHQADSAVRFRTPDGIARELEVIYCDPADGSELRLVLQHTGVGRMPYPPEAEKHPSRTEQVTVRGRTVHLACVSPTIGVFDAVWQEPSAGVDGKLLTSAKEGMDRARVLGCLDTVLATVPALGETL